MIAAESMSYPLSIHSNDELGEMAVSFNQMQEEIARAAAGLDVARESLRRSREELVVAHASLAEREERFRQLAENINQVFWMNDVQSHRLLYVSPAYEIIWGRSIRSLYEDPRSFLESIHAEDRGRITAGLGRQMAGGYDVQYRLVQPGGAVRWIHDRAFPVRDAAGVVYRVVGIAEDITERELAQSAVHAAKEEAERANNAKNEFLSRVSHELRTPLNAILGFGQILEGDCTGDQRQCAEHILKAGSHLLDLVNEVLDLASIEAGRLVFSPESVSLRLLIRESLQLIGPLAEQRSIRLASHYPDGRDVHVFADHQRLKQVVINLLSNAVKYNRSAGSIEIECTRAGPERVRIAVRDTGLGLPPEKVALLFTPFQRLGAERTSVPGAGLGLTLSKRLVDLMGGGIGVESEPGQGSVFWVELPLAQSPVENHAPAENGADPGTPPAGQRSVILYIEDNLSNLRLVEAILARRGNIDLIPAMQGTIGLELARQHRPHLVLLDLDLPDISGRDVFQRLRADPATSAAPVIIVSADATHSEIERMLGEGASAYVTKPIDVKRFLRMVDAVLQGQRVPAREG